MITLKRILILICVLILFSCSQKESFYKIDPRFELINIIQLLGDFDKDFGDAILNHYDSDYRKDVLKHFAKFKNHNAVALLRKHALNDGLQVSEAPSLILSYSNPPALEKKYELDPDVARVFKNRADADKLIQAIRSFSVESKFLEFFEVHQDLYNQFVLGEKKRIRTISKIVQWLKDYYVDDISAYRITLSPLQGPGSVGLTAFENGKKVAIFKSGVQDYRNGRLYFSNDEQYFGLLIHEFSHPSINPLVDKYFALFSNKKYLHDKIKSKLPKWYGTWRIVLYEHIVRAVTIRCLDRLGYKGLAARFLERDLKNGFSYLPKILKALTFYENNRTKFPNLDSFFPEIVKAL